MEKFLLGTLTTGDELNIVDEKQVRFPIFAAKFDILLVLNSVNQLIGELIALDVHHIHIGIVLADLVGNGVKQVGLTHTGRAIQKQRVVGFTGGLSHGDGGTVRHAVGRTDNKAVEGELGIEIHGIGFTSGLEGLIFFLTQNLQFGIGFK